MFKASTILGWLRWAVVGTVGLLATTLFTLWLTAYSDEQKWFAHPSDQLAKFMNIAASILSSAYLHWGGGIILGFAAGVWLDDILRRLAAKELRPEKPSEPTPGEPTALSRIDRLAVPQTKEQKRETDARKMLIGFGRTIVAESVRLRWSNETFKRELESCKSYYALRPYLSDSFQKMMLPPDPNMVACDGTKSNITGLARAFLAEIDRLQKEWDLL